MLTSCDAADVPNLSVSCHDPFCSAFLPQVRSTISDFAVFLTIVVMVLIDFLIGIPSPKLHVPHMFKVMGCLGTAGLTLCPWGHLEVMEGKTKASEVSGLGDEADVPALSQPTRDDRGWLISPIGPNPWWTVLAALIPALLCTILIFMDQQITAVIVNRKEHRLKVRGCKR